MPACASQLGAADRSGRLRELGILAGEDAEELRRNRLQKVHGFGDLNVESGRESGEPRLSEIRGRDMQLRA